MNRTGKGEVVGEALFALAITGSFGYALIQTRHWGMGAAMFPLLIATPGVLLGLAVSIRTLLKFRQQEAPESATGKNHGGDIRLDRELLSADALLRTVAIFGWILGLLSAVWLLGQKIALPLFVLLYLKSAGERWLPTLLLTLATIAFLMGVFDQVIHIAWHQGVLFEWLGWEPL